MSDDLLEMLSAEREIRQQLAIYCRAVDRFDVELWKSVWHPDATLDYRSVELRGTAHAMARVMVLGHEPWASHSHQFTWPAIVVKGDRAVSESVNNAILFGSTKDSASVVDSHYRGRYLDRWSRRGGRWAIDHRSAPGGLMWRQTSVESQLGSRSRRDRSDPSYELLASLEPGSDSVLELLTAEHDIRRQLHNYCRAVDRGDVELCKSVWHPDGTFDSSDSGLRGTVADLAELMTCRDSAWASQVHQCTNSVIAINRDHAVSETYATNVLRSRAAASGRCLDTHERTRYLDRWSRRKRGWAIDHRQVVRDFTWSQDSVEGSVGPRARCDRGDPSYRILASLG